MRVQIRWVLLVCLLARAGCGKSTDQLISDLNSPDAQERDRTIAVRTLPQHKGDAAKVVPALIGALKDKDAGIRWNAAIGLGYFGDQARDAIPALQEAQHDPDPRVREGASVALSRIDPTRFAPPSRVAGK